MSAIIRQAIQTWKECRAAFEDHLLAEYEKASEECRGRLLNRRGVKAGVDSASLFMGNQVRAHAYASEELLEYWQYHERPTFERFEKQWLEDPDDG